MNNEEEGPLCPCKRCGIRNGFCPYWQAKHDEHMAKKKKWFDRHTITNEIYLCMDVPIKMEEEEVYCEKGEE